MSPSSFPCRRSGRGTYSSSKQTPHPHQLGKRTIRSGVMCSFLISLIVAEIGAFLVIFSGYLAA